MADVDYPFPDTSGLMPRPEAEAAIAGFDARITALEQGKKSLAQIATATVGETALISLSLGVRRYTVSAPGAVTADRIVVALTGAPSNGTVQDAYVNAANTVSVGVLVPALGVGAVVSVPVVLYKVV